MIRNLVLAVAAGVSAAACPALGQERSDLLVTPASTGVIESENGYRRAETNGFHLVEHGIWPIPQTSARGASTPDASRRADLSVRRSERARDIPTSFRRAAYLPHVYAAEARYALPTGLLDALVWTESRYNPLAVSKAGAAGLGQLMPGTARELGVTNRFDPLENLSGAAKYLHQMLDRFGVVHLALAAYNAGPGAVERAKGIPRNDETPGYVRNVLDRWRP
jgi:soluble lytic murein transglycosylase-like protein